MPYRILAQNWPCGPFLARYCVGKARRDPTIFLGLRQLYWEIIGTIKLNIFGVFSDFLSYVLKIDPQNRRQKVCWDFRETSAVHPWVVGDFA